MNAGGVTVFAQASDCEDTRQLRARLEDLRNKFQVTVWSSYVIGIFYR